MERERQEREGEEQEYPQVQEGMEREDFRAKKDLLRKEISQYYNQDQKILDQFVDSFQNFVRERRKYNSILGGDIDLNLVTLSELQELVNTFKFNLAHQNSAITMQVDPLPPNQARRSLIMQELEPTQLQKTFYGNKAWDYTMRIPNVVCNKEKEFFCNQTQRVKITVNGHSLHTQSYFFGLSRKTTLILELTTVFLGKQITVSRTVDDFFFLQKILSNIFPYTFVAPLQITPTDLRQIENESVKQKVISKCQQFLTNQILEKQNLLENVYTFRFLVQQKKENYEEHKKNNIKKEVNHVNQLKNSSGKISIDISQASQRAKMSLSCTSKLFKESWGKIQDLTVQIEQKLASIDQSMFKIVEELRKINLAINNQQRIADFKFSSYSKTIETYRKTIDTSANFLKTCSQYFQNLKKQFIDKTFTKWTHFQSYRDRLMKKSDNYQERRKVYLQTQSEKILKPYNSPMDLKIGMLNLQKNKQEEKWIEEQSFWYGYLNFEMIKTYENFVRSDQQNLKNSQNYALLALIQSIELSKRQLLSFISKET